MVDHQMPWRTASIQILREAYPYNLTEREIAIRVEQQGLRTYENAKTPHLTVSSVLGDYIKTHSNCEVTKTGPAMWCYKPRDQEQIGNLQEKIKQEMEASEREQTEIRFKKDLIDFIHEMREFCQTNEPTRKMHQLAVQLHRIRSRNQLAQKLDFDETEQQINSTVIVGNTGIGKTFVMNALLRLGCPLIDLDDVTGGYDWNNQTRTAIDRDYLINSEVVRVLSELALLGLSIEQQDAILTLACGGLTVQHADRVLLADPQKELRRELKIEGYLEKRLAGAWNDDQHHDIFKYPYLLSTMRNASSSTTAYPTHIRYGGLPASILVFKTPAQMMADLAELNRNGTYTDEEIHGAMKLCQENRVELNIGKGRNFTEDRVYLRDKIIEQHENLAYSLAVEKRIILFPDAALRNGSERVDTPGSGDENPICKKNLLALMEKATQVVCLVSQGLENDSPLIKLLQNFYPKLLTDPLNYCLHLIEMPERSYQLPNKRKNIDRFFKGHNNERARKNASGIIKKGLEEARKTLVEQEIETFDIDRCQPEMYRFFPALFLAQCIRYHKLESDSSPQAVELVQNMRAIGGLEVLGGLHKISFGYELRATENFLSQAEQIIPHLPGPLVAPLRRLYDSMTKYQCKLSDLTLEANTNQSIGETLLKSGQSIFPKCPGNDFDCTLNCAVNKRKEVGGNMIECSHCSHWYHFDCVGVRPGDWSKRDYFCDKPECMSHIVPFQTPQRKRKSALVPTSKRQKV